MEAYFDIGGTNIRYILCDSGGNKEQFLLKSEGCDIVVLLKDLIKKKSLKRVGISFAGQVEEGVIKSSPNIDIESINLKKEIEDSSECLLEIDNDLNCAALAEAEFFGCDNILVIYSGTGLGGACISGGKLLRGSQNQALEIGHLPFRDTEYRCGCGRKNCVELFASGSGMRKRVGVESKIDLLLFKESRELNRIYSDYVEALSFAIGSAISLLNPSLVVLGGGVFMPNRDILCQKVRERVVEYAFPSSYKKEMIVSSEIDDAGIRGAMMLFKNR